jgi:hypothetical protein
MGSIATRQGGVTTPRNEAFIYEARMARKRSDTYRTVQRTVLSAAPQRVLPPNRGIPRRPLCLRWEMVHKDLQKCLDILILARHELEAVTEAFRVSRCTS